MKRPRRPIDAERIAAAQRACVMVLIPVYAVLRSLHAEGVPDHVILRVFDQLPGAITPRHLPP